MKKPLLTLTYVLAYAAFTFSLAVCSHAQTATVIANFDSQVASIPIAPVQGTDGNFYGIAALGGVLDDGLIYRMTPTGSLSSVYRFCSQKPRCADGKDVLDGLILATELPNEQGQLWWAIPAAPLAALAVVAPFSRARAEDIEDAVAAPAAAA